MIEKFPEIKSYLPEDGPVIRDKYEAEFKNEDGSKVTDQQLKEAKTAQQTERATQLMLSMQSWLTPPEKSRNMLKNS